MRDYPFVYRILSGVPNLKKQISCLIIMFCLIFFCSREKTEKIETVRIIENPLTWERTFGHDESQKDHFLVRPYFKDAIAVKSDGTVMISDEYRLKVFDKLGNPVKIIGRQGQGPGEFGELRSIWCSPNDYYCVYHGSGFGGYYINYYNPEDRYIGRRMFHKNKRINELLKQDDLFGRYADKVHFLGENEFVYIIESRDINFKKDRLFDFLIYETPDTLIKLAKHPNTNHIRIPSVGRMSPGGVYVKPEMGRMYLAVLPGRRIAYLHSHEDSELSANAAQFTITVLSLDTMKKSEIKQSYTPVPFDFKPSSPRKRSDDIFEKVYGERKYKAAISELRADGDFLFAFTYLHKDSTNVLVNVFNSRSNKHISSTYLPSGTVCIQDGFLYKFNDYRKEDKFPAVEKFRINPELYGK